MNQPILFFSHDIPENELPVNLASFLAKAEGIKLPVEFPVTHLPIYYWSLSGYEKQDQSLESLLVELDKSHPENYSLVIFEADDLGSSFINIPSYIGLGGHLLYWNDAVLLAEKFNSNVLSKEHLLEQVTPVSRAELFFKNILQSLNKALVSEREDCSLELTLLVVMEKDFKPVEAIEDFKDNFRGVVVKVPRALESYYNVYGVTNQIIALTTELGYFVRATPIDMSKLVFEDRTNSFSSQVITLYQVKINFS